MGTRGAGSSPAAPMVDRSCDVHARGKERGVIGPAARIGGFARASCPQGRRHGRRGGWRRAAGLRPMAEGGARAGECAVAAWHRPKGGRRVMPRRHIMLTEPGLGPAVAGLLRHVHPVVRRRGRRGMSRRDVARGLAPAQYISMWPSLNQIYSKFHN
jgi:hypothetical protein